MSIRAITRLTGVSKTTVSKLVVDAGQAAAWYQDRVFQSLTCKRLQIDEIWGFVGAKQKNVARHEAPHGDAGDAWLWLATDADTKLVPCWHVGGRDGDAAMEFIDDLASRLAPASKSRRTVTRLISMPIDTAFGGEVDYAQLVKLYGAAPESEGPLQPRRMHRHNQDARERDPDMTHVSTSYAERNNLNVRMHSRRMTGYERLLKEDGKPRSRDGASFSLLQFRPHP